MYLLMVACEQPEPTPPNTFDPVAVGLGYDGVVSPEGQLTGYSVGGAEQAPMLVLIFGSEAYFGASDAETRDAESCVAVGTLAASPSPDPLPTWDGSALFWSYELGLPIEQSDCAGRVDPERWGEDASGLLDRFADAHFGFGVGPMTDLLRDAWSSETLDAVGPSMVAEWFALTDASGGWVGGDWTTGVTFQVDEATGELPTEIDPETGDELLIPEVIEGLVPGDPLPALYVRSYPVWYQDFVLMDLDAL
ncbi:MAG: hypothetical protein ABMA64_21250 [Myxococcota bacterium]